MSNAMKLSRWSDLINESESQTITQKGYDRQMKRVGDVPKVTGK